MPNNKNNWTLLTPPGEGAIQVVALDDLDSDIEIKLEKHFQAHFPGKKKIRVGHLFDESGEIIDEVILESRPQEVRLHLHGGEMPLHRVRMLFDSWGIAFQDSCEVDTLEEELHWALTRAQSQQAYEMALKSYEKLPNLTSPNPQLLKSFGYGFSLFNPTRYILVGKPNAGKSSLINRILGQERVVVTDTPGTTRDLIEAPLIVSSRPVTLVDGAGLRETSETLEQEGQKRVRASLDQAQPIWVVNPHQDLEPCPVASPAALILTHQDLGSGHSVDFEGPVARTSQSEGSESVMYLLETLLPSPCEEPVIFTKRQYRIIEESLKDNHWDPDEWRGSVDFPRF